MLKKILENLLPSLDGSEFMYGDVDMNLDSKWVTDEAIQLDKAGVESWEVVDSYGGEGQGDDYYSVYKFTMGDETEYVKFQGWYVSYSGAEYTDYRFVEPKQVTRTEYV